MRAGWRKTSNNLFRSLKKADKAGFEFREGTCARDCADFYRLYLHTMRKHRTLPRRLRQLELTRDLLGPGEFRLFLVEHDGRLAAGGVFHVFGGTVELIYNGSDDGMLDLRPNHALYWNVIRWAPSRVSDTFDFGEASPTTSLGRFKSQWAEPVPNYRYTWRAGDAPSRAEVDGGRVLRGRARWRQPAACRSLDPCTGSAPALRCGGRLLLPVAAVQGTGRALEIGGFEGAVGAESENYRSRQADDADAVGAPLPVAVLPPSSIVPSTASMPISSCRSPRS